MSHPQPNSALERTLQRGQAARLWWWSVAKKMKCGYVQLQACHTHGICNTSFIRCCSTLGHYVSGPKMVKGFQNWSEAFKGEPFRCRPTEVSTRILRYVNIILQASGFTGSQSQVKSINVHATPGRTTNLTNTTPKYDNWQYPDSTSMHQCPSRLSH